MSFSYRSGRILADKVQDDAQALECLHQCLEMDPGFAPALALLREIAIRAGAYEQVYEMQRKAAAAAARM